MKENSETGYTFSTKIPEPIEGERILGTPPRQFTGKVPPPALDVLLRNCRGEKPFGISTIRALSVTDLPVMMS